MGGSTHSLRVALVAHWKGDGPWLDYSTVCNNGDRGTRLITSSQEQGD